MAASTESAPASVATPPATSASAATQAPVSATPLVRIVIGI